MFNFIYYNVMNAANNRRVVIIEDEVHNSRMLKGMIEKLRPDWKILSILESVEESVVWFEKNKAPDLILMDIQLSDGICFTIFEKVKIDPLSRIIFTTAYDEYAIRAFKVNSIDYLLKPVEESDLENAFTKFEQLDSTDKDHLIKTQEHYQDLIHTILNSKKEYRKRFLISGVSSYQKIETENISYIYSENKLTFAVDFNSKQYTLDYNLEQVESELDPEKFFRANRKVIVNIDAVTKVSTETGSKLKVYTNPQPDFEIIVSRLKAGDFKNWLGK